MPFLTFALLFEFNGPPKKSVYKKTYSIETLFHLDRFQSTRKILKGIVLLIMCLTVFLEC